MTRILMLASFGLEIVECGGTLARHVQAGDEVFSAVLLSRPESRPQVTEAAKILGIEHVEFLQFPYGEWTVDIPWKEKIVELVRRIKPDLVITQDPEHAQHDLDPDRRLIALLYTEAFALAGRVWRVAECGGHEPHTLRSIYYMTPEHPNCVVEISATFALKQQALAVLGSQLEFSAQSIEQRASAETLRFVVPDYDTLQSDKRALGLALHTAFDKALALVNGLAGHSGATMAEAYRREGVFVLDGLMK
ncbi:MAG: GlcNAc-PI de-N-acetylase [Chloroflexi bacterium]|nr:GlcNAc-PI de-N-acetylase [Chloroflexota bacterium]